MEKERVINGKTLIMTTEEKPDHKLQTISSGEYTNKIRTFQNGDRDDIINFSVKGYQNPEHYKMTAMNRKSISGTSSQYKEYDSGPITNGKDAVIGQYSSYHEFNDDHSAYSKLHTTWEIDDGSKEYLYATDGSKETMVQSSTIDIYDKESKCTEKFTMTENVENGRKELTHEINGKMDLKIIESKEGTIINQYENSSSYKTDVYDADGKPILPIAKGLVAIPGMEQLPANYIDNVFFEKLPDCELVMCQLPEEFAEFKAMEVEEQTQEQDAARNDDDGR